MELALFWIVSSVAVGAIASGRGRSGIGWFLFSILLTPLLGLVLVMCLDRLNTPLRERLVIQPAPVGAPRTASHGGGGFAALFAVVVLVAIVLASVGSPSDPPQPTVASVSHASMPRITMKVREVCPARVGVAMPRTDNIGSLRRCREVGKAYLKTMIGNLHAVVACRKEAVRLAGPQTAAARQVEQSNHGVLQLLPELESGGDAQLRKNSTTLAACRAHLGKLAQFASMQPEFLGKWD